MADMPSRAAEREGGVLLADRYRLGSRLGSGGMSDVYAAQDELLHRAVAVKVFRADGLPDSEWQRVDAEIRTLAGLRHPGLVTVFDAGGRSSEGGDADAFLVMELIHGPTLRHRLADGPLPPSETVRLGLELASSLAYVHAQGVVHRDVKPANILLDEHRAQDQGCFTAKLTDFGIARLVDSTRLTAHGTTIGTANYLSPEQAAGQVSGPAGDVYSLGLVLLECLTGQLAYPGSGVEAAVARLHHQPAIPATLGEDWIRLLGAMTDRDPDRRPTASEVARSLGDLAGRAEASDSTGDGSAAVTQVMTDADGAHPRTLLLPRGRAQGWRLGHARWIGLAAAGAVLLLVLALVFVFASTGHRGSSGTPSPAPSYPSVSGPIGSHLQQLEGAVG